MEEAERIVGESPEIRNSDVGRMLRIRKAAGIAGFAQGKILDKGREIGILKEIGRVDFPVVKTRFVFAVRPAGNLVAETVIGHLRMMKFFQVSAVSAEDRGGGDAVADDVGCQQIRVRLPEKAVQSRHLAGGSGKQHLASGPQKVADLKIRIAGFALHVFGLAEFFRLFRCFGKRVADFPVFRPNRAEDCAVLREDFFCEQPEDSAGSRFLEFFCIFVPCRITCEDAGVRFGISAENRTAFFAETAVYAQFFRNFRVKKAAFVRCHAYGVLRTDCFADAAAAAEIFIADFHTAATSSVCQLIS